MTLIESNTRKAAFLSEVGRQTGVPVDIYPERIENVATQYKVGPVDVITARGLAPMPRLLELASPLASFSRVAGCRRNSMKHLGSGSFRLNFVQAKRIETVK